MPAVSVNAVEAVGRDSDETALGAVLKGYEARASIGIRDADVIANLTCLVERQDALDYRAIVRVVEALWRARTVAIIAAPFRWVGSAVLSRCRRQGPQAFGITPTILR